jgi:HEAT repeats
MLLLIFLLGLFSISGAKQIPAVGIIDFYGLRSVTEAQVRKALQISEGETLPDSLAAAQARLEKLPNVAEAHLNVACCEAGKVILYVGIREKGSRPNSFRHAPLGSVRLPERILQAGKEFQEYLEAAVLKGNLGEDYSAGHALSVDSQVRSVQERFITFAAEDFSRLRKVLHESSDPKHRALAAQIIAYAANKPAIVADLQFAMTDPDENVRNNAMRALMVLASYSLASPRQRIRIRVLPFVAMLNSFVWTDRNKASSALQQLTVKRDPAVLAILRKRALPSLIEMARWKSPGHAGASFFILGRVGNIPESEIERSWASGDRETMILRVIKETGGK